MVGQHAAAESGGYGHRFRSGPLDPEEREAFRGQDPRRNSRANYIAPAHGRPCPASPVHRWTTTSIESRRHGHLAPLYASTARICRRHPRATHARVARCARAASAWSSTPPGAAAKARTAWSWAAPRVGGRGWSEEGGRDGLRRPKGRSPVGNPREGRGPLRGACWV